MRVVVFFSFLLRSIIFLLWYFSPENKAIIKLAQTSAAVAIGVRFYWTETEVIKYIELCLHTQVTYAVLCSVLNIQSHGSSVITTCVGSQKAKRARLCCNLNIDGLRLNTSFLLHGRRKKERRSSWQYAVDRCCNRAVWQLSADGFILGHTWSSLFAVSSLINTVRAYHG